MKKVFLGAAAAIVIAAPAQAANLPVKAPPVVAETIYSWTGFHIGVNGGWSRTGYDQQWVLGPGATVNPSRSNGIIGGHFGAMYQINRLVIGFEAAWSAMPGDNWTGLVPANASTFNTQLKLGHLFMIGPRLGWTPRDRWLLTVGGGYATATVTQRLFSAAGAIQPDLATHERHNGWYAGGGIDYAVTQNIVAGVEYQHVGLNNRQHCREPRKIAGTCLGAGDDSTSNIRPHVDIVRARLSIKFWGASPVVARY